MKVKRINPRTTEVFVVTEDNIEELTKKYGYRSTVFKFKEGWCFECYTNDSVMDVYTGYYLIVETDPEDKYYLFNEVFTSEEDFLKVYELVEE